MALAIFEAYYSRPIAPTRRVALGRMLLPVDPAPGFGGVLLGGIMARFARELDEDTDEELDVLLDLLEAGSHIGQPRLRHRFQADRVGLTRCRHRLEASGEQFRFVFDSHVGTPTQHVLCAAYAAAAIETEERPALFAALRKGLDWVGPIDDALVRYLSDRRTLGHSVGSDPVGWALYRLGIAGPMNGDDLHVAVSRAFRTLLIEAHPDHGGSVELAADRIAELREARRILLAS
ncbi:MAG: hypothetical protein K1X38_13765 [Microthrixaceae bacterium]|nr:hypothetical protein [Microthrixaceae bacterium]